MKKKTPQERIYNSLNLKNILSHEIEDLNLWDYDEFNIKKIHPYVELYDLKIKDHIKNCIICTCYIKKDETTNFIKILKSILPETDSNTKLHNKCFKAIPSNSIMANNQEGEINLDIVKTIDDRLIVQFYQLNNELSSANNSPL